MNEEKRNELAKSVVRLSRNTLLVGLRFLDHAINELRIRQSEEGTIWTEGKYFTYNPQYILEQYVTERELPVRDYLHTLLHCIFRHMYGTSNLQPRIWNLACDIAVEYTITELNQPSTRCKKQSDQENTLKLLKMQIGLMTAEKIYRYYLDQNLPPFKLTRLEALFSADDHRNWYTYKPKKMLEANEEGNETEPSAEDTPDSSDPKAEESETPEDFSPPEDFVVPLPEEGDGSASFPESFYYQEDQEAIWKVISGRMQVDLDTFSSAYGDCVGNLTQNLRSINREKYDYSSFLRKFATREEMMRLNDDEFDYIYYTYGLKHYKTMPLIEPLEYKEIKIIREGLLQGGKLTFPGYGGQVIRVRHGDAEADDGIVHGGIADCGDIESVAVKRLGQPFTGNGRGFPLGCLDRAELGIAGNSFLFTLDGHGEFNGLFCILHDFRCERIQQTVLQLQVEHGNVGFLFAAGYIQHPV